MMIGIKVRLEAMILWLGLEGLGQEKKYVVLPSVTDPSQKTKFKKKKKKIGSRIHVVRPIFIRLGVFFFTFFEKKVENVPKFCTFGYFKKMIKKIYFTTDRPKYSEISLGGNTAIFFFRPYGMVLFYLLIILHVSCGGKSP